MDQQVTRPLQNDGEIARRQHQVGRSILAFRGVCWSAISVSVPAIVNLLVFMVASRVLSPADFGIVALAASIAMLAAAIGPAGFGEALVQRASIRTEHVDSVFWLCMAFGVACYSLLFVNAGAIASLFGAPGLAILVQVFGVRVILDMASIVPNALIVRSLSFHLVALRTLIATLIAAAISIGLLLAGYGLWALVFAQLATSIVKVITDFWTSGYRPGARIRFAALKELSGYGVFASGNLFVQFLGAKADQTLVGYLLGVSSVGIYNFARRIYQMTNDIVSGALGTVSHPLFSEVQNELEKIRRGYLVSTFISTAISFPIYVGIALVADRGIPLIFDEKWMDALGPLRLLCALGMISCIGVLQASLIKSRGRADWWFWYQLISSLLNIALVVIFARFGVTIMLAAMVAKAFLVWPASVSMTLRLLSMNLGTYMGQIAAPFLACVAMAAAVLLAREFLGETSSPLGLAADVAIGGATYLAALFALAPRKVADISGIILRAAKAR